MKRTPLARRSPLQRRKPLKARPKPRTRTPEERAWKIPRAGRCENCGLLVDWLHGHHVIERQRLAFLGLPEYEPRVRMDLCPVCHMNHHGGLENRKIALEKLPASAVLFAAAHGLMYELERRYR